jgi:hypothetical protein
MMTAILMVAWLETGSLLVCCSLLLLFQSILLVGLCRTDLEYAYLTLFSLSMILKGEWRESGGLVRRRC